MPSSVTTSHLPATTALRFARAISSGNNVFVTIGQPNETLDQTAVDSADEIGGVVARMIGGQKIQPGDVALSTSRQDWISGTTYAQYNAFQTTPCFVTSAVGSVLRVYKCLENNDGQPSTVQPTSTVTGPFVTSDQYKWILMWEVPQVTRDKFATPTTVPVVVSPSIQAAAISQTIDTFTIDDAGRGYSNYFVGSIQQADVISTTSIRVSGLSSSLTNFYSQCVLEITNPSSPAYGQVRVITGYNGGTKTATLGSALNGVQLNDTYEIRPQVVVTAERGSGFLGSARINTSSNTVSQIVVHARGSGYINATASVVAANTVTIQHSASVTPHCSTVHGHGSEPLTETNANIVTISATIANTSPLVAGVGKFAQVALITDPLFDNVVYSSGSPGVSLFTPGESIVGLKIRGRFAANTTAGSSVLTTDASILPTSLQSGDVIATMNSTMVGLSTVTNTGNTTSVPVTTTIPIVGQSYGVDPVTVGTVKSANSTAVVLTNVVSGVNKSVDNLVGLSSKRYATGSQLVYSGGSNTIVNVATIHGTISGTFTPGSVITGTDFTVIGQTSNTVVGFSPTMTIANTGTLTQGSANVAVSSVDSPSYVKNSGSVIYINNNAPINIAANRTVSVVLTVSF